MLKSPTSRSMISRPFLPSDLLMDCSGADKADWHRAKSRIVPQFNLARLACVSLDRADAPARIAARIEGGRIVLALATIARKAQRKAALAAGVHEFLTTGPIDPGQLQARLALLAKGSATPPEMALDSDACHLIIGGAGHRLTERETTLLATLLRAKGGFVTHEDLLKSGWGPNATDRQYLRVAINRLRSRIEPEPDMPRYILNEPAIGYRIGSGVPPRIAS